MVRMSSSETELTNLGDLTSFKIKLTFPRRDSACMKKYLSDIVVTAGQYCNRRSSKFLTTSEGHY